MKCLLVKQIKCTGFLFCEEVVLVDILSQYIRGYDSGYGFNKTFIFNKTRVENIFFPVLWVVFFFFKSY